MELIWQISLFALLGYFLGSLSFAKWIAAMHGVNIFEVGSGNPGATNVKRALGAKVGNTVFLLDFLKGFAAAGLPWFIMSGEHNEMLAIVGLVFAVIGHSFSIFLKFRGGKGVATTMGGLLAIMPVVVIIGILVWLLVFYSLRYVSLASILFGVSLPISALLLKEPSWFVGFSIFIAVVLVVRHKSNIVRLMQGTENRFVKKPKPQEGNS